MSRLEDLGSDGLLELLVGRRWFAAEGRREPERAQLERIVHADDVLEIALVDVRFADGAQSTYVVAVGSRGEDAFEHRPALARLVALAGAETPCATARVVGVEQSNSSVVLDESIVLKLYRRLEEGPSPEVELLRALEEAGFKSAPRLRGVFDDTGGRLEATVAIVTEYVPAAGGGWELTLAALATGDTGWLPARAARLGEVTGSMHASLAAASDPRMAPQTPEPDAVDSLSASIDEEVVRLASDFGPILDGAIGSGSPTSAFSCEIWLASAPRA